MANTIANQVVSLDWNNATETYVTKPNKIDKAYLTELNTPQFVSHNEDGYNDFDYEGLIYKKLSQEGPSLAVADVNNQIRVNTP